MTYYSPVYDGDIVYSCDMLRLKFSVNALRRDSFYKMMLHFENRIMSYNYDYYKSSKIGSYAHLFACVYDTESVRCGKFTVGVDLIEAIRSPSVSCMIEFNPNKSDMEFIRRVLNELAFYVQPVEGKYFQLVRYDLAVDIPVERENVVLLKQGKRKYQRVIEKSVTEYLGCRNTNGFIKVYDKQIESNLDNALTRIEITCNSLDTFPLPKVCLLQESLYDDFSELNSTDMVLINLIRRLGFDEQQQMLKQLGRTKREKLKGHIFPFEQEFKFNMNSIYWITVFINQILTNFQSNWEFRIDENKQIKVKEEEIINNDEIYKQYNIFDK